MERFKIEIKIDNMEDAMELINKLNELEKPKETKRVVEAVPIYYKKSCIFNKKQSTEKDDAIKYLETEIVCLQEELRYYKLKKESLDKKVEYYKNLAESYGTKIIDQMYDNVNIEAVAKSLEEMLKKESQSYKGR